MKIQLKRSSVLDGGTAKQPLPDQLEYGELAVNYNATDPTIFIKASDNAIIPIAGGGAVTSIPNLEEVLTAGNFSDSRGILIGGSLVQPNIEISTTGNISSKGYYRSNKATNTDVAFEALLSDAITFKVIGNGGVALGGTIDSTSTQTGANIFLDADSGKIRASNNIACGGTPSDANITLEATGNAKLIGTLQAQSLSDGTTTKTMAEVLTDKLTPTVGNETYLRLDTTNSPLTNDLVIQGSLQSTSLTDGTTTKTMTEVLNAGADQGGLTPAEADLLYLKLDGSNDPITGSLAVNGTITSNGSTLATTTDISNYAPSKTGSGASGTWNISITGSAGSAQLATHTIWGQSFNGTQNVTGDLALQSGKIYGNSFQIGDVSNYTKFTMNTDASSDGLRFYFGSTYRHLLGGSTYGMRSIGALCSSSNFPQAPDTAGNYSGWKMNPGGSGYSNYYQTSASNANLWLTRQGSTGGQFVKLNYGASAGSSKTIGSIAASGGSSTKYNTSSDYRLKQNITDITDAVAILKTLPVKKFEFISNPGTRIDGFVAHNLAAVYPEAVTGAKDEMAYDDISGDALLDENGNHLIEPQGVDYSTLVPILVKALQEAITRIEALEAP